MKQLTTKPAKLRYIAIVPLLVLLVTGCQKKTVFRDFKRSNGDFSLIETTNEKLVDRKDLPLPALLFVGYTSCPDICPMTLGRLQAVFKALPKLQQKMHVIFLTVDPKRDTPERLRQYLSSFKLPAIGLTGTKKQIDQAVKSLNAIYEVSKEKSAAGPLFGHSSYVYLLDQNSRVRYVFGQSDTTEAMAKVLHDFINIEG